MLTVCGLVAALSLTESVPLLAPIAEGLNLMLIVFAMLEIVKVVGRLFFASLQEPRRRPCVTCLPSV